MLAIMLLCETAILLGIEWKNVNSESGEIKICATGTSVSKETVECSTKTYSGTQITERTYVHAKRDLNRGTRDSFQKSVFQE